LLPRCVHEAKRAVVPEAAHHAVERFRKVFRRRLLAREAAVAEERVVCQLFKVCGDVCEEGVRLSAHVAQFGRAFRTLSALAVDKAAHGEAFGLEPCCGVLHPCQARLAADGSDYVHAKVVNRARNDGAERCQQEEHPPLHRRRQRPGHLHGATGRRLEDKARRVDDGYGRREKTTWHLLI